MPMADIRKIADLKRALAALEAPAAAFAAAAPLLSFGADFVDEAIGGGLPIAALHEIYPAGTGDGAAASGFALAMMLRSAPGRKIVWIRQDMAARELGELYPPGLAEFGADPDAIISVQARDAVSALRAGNEALRCSALGAVAIEIWGGEKAVDLTATRRLLRAADTAGTTAFLIRFAAEPVPSAAVSRWRVRTSASASLVAEAPGASRFDIELMRHRAGFPPRTFCVEWDRDECVFRKPALSRFMAAVSADRPAASDQTPFRRAG